MKRKLLMLAVLVGFPAAALGQEPALAGPEVVVPDRDPTLVEIDYAGRVRRLEQSPEEGALKMLALDSATRAATDRILTERARILDDLVISNIDLLTKLGTASAAEDKKAQFALILELYMKMEPLRERGTLRGEIEGVLEDPAKERFARLVDGYWDAIVREQQGAKDGKPEARFAILAREKLQLFGEEVGRSFYRQLDPERGEREFEAFLGSIGLRPEQEQKIRRMAEEFIVAAKFRPTERQEQMFFLRILSMLDEEQRERLIRKVAADEAAKRGGP